MNEEAMPAAPPEAVTVEQFDAHVQQMADVKTRLAIAARVKADLEIEFSKLSERASMYLKALGRKNYPAPFGTVYLAKMVNMKGPQTDADKAKLFDWMRERGIFDKYASVNVQSLKSLYMAELESATREDPAASLTFSIPGVERPTTYETVKVMKGKGASDDE